MGNYFENLTIEHVCVVIDIAPTHAKTRALNCFVDSKKIFFGKAHAVTAAAVAA